MIEPASHVMQSSKAAEPAVPTYSPTGQSMQSVASFEPDAATYLPASQSVHDATFDAIEYLPATHGVHVVAPVFNLESVIEPAAHVMQLSAPD